MAEYEKLEQAATKSGSNPVELLYLLFDRRKLIPQDMLHRGLARAVINRGYNNQLPPVEIQRELAFFKGIAKDDLEAYLMGVLAAASEDPKSKLNMTLKQYLEDNVTRELQNPETPFYRMLLQLLTCKESPLLREYRDALKLEAELELTGREQELQELEKSLQAKEKEYAERERKIVEEEERLKKWGEAQRAEAERLRKKRDGSVVKHDN